VDQNHIMVTVAPPANAQMQPVTITAGNSSVTGNILSTPVIQQNGNTVSSPTTPPPAVIGEQIHLITSPNQQTLPSGFTIKSSSWTLNGTYVAGYSASVTNETVTNVTQDDLTNDEITFYWVAKGNNIPVQFYYCVDIAGVPDPYDCSLPASANFEVDGFTNPNVTPSGQVFFIGGIPPVMNWGIQFTASGTPPSGYSGTFTWIQLVTSTQWTWFFSNGDPPLPCIGKPGFDAGSNPVYPYATGLNAEDGPSLAAIPVPPTISQNETTESSQFQMYLMWNPNTGSGDSASIPVPLGSISWNTAGDVEWNLATQSWQKKAGTTNATTAGSFWPSSTYPPPWQNAASTECQN
jgi:hypothetical protein